MDIPEGQVKPDDGSVHVKYTQLRQGTWMIARQISGNQAQFKDLHLSAQF